MIRHHPNTHLTLNALELKHLVAEGNTLEALQRLRMALEELGVEDETYNKVILALARLKRLQDSSLAGQRGLEAGFNQINLDTLRLIDLFNKMNHPST